MFSSKSILPFELFGLILLFFGLVAAAGVMLAHEFSRQERLGKRLGIVTGSEVEVEEEGPNHDGPLPLRIISAFGMLVVRSGLFSRQNIAEITATLEGIGLRGGRGLGVFIGLKVLLLVTVPFFLIVVLHGFFVGKIYLFIKGLGGMLGGSMAPETYAKNKRGKHLEKVEQGVPDALDMMVICADAGLALEASIARVAQEIQMLNPNLAQELTQTSRELQIGADMRQVMDSLGNRTGLEVLKRLSTTLAQSLQYGTPLTQALRSLSSELRGEALIKFEERAGRLPTMMTMPMILFILPCVFFIVAGPAIINVMATFKGQ